MNFNGFDMIPSRGLLSVGGYAQDFVGRNCATPVVRPGGMCWGMQNEEIVVGTDMRMIGRA